MTVQNKPYSFNSKTGPWRRRILAFLEENGPTSATNCALLLLERFPTTSNSKSAKGTVISALANMGCHDLIESAQPPSTPSTQRIWALTESGRQELTRLRALDTEHGK